MDTKKLVLERLEKFSYRSELMVHSSVLRGTSPYIKPYDVHAALQSLAEDGKVRYDDRHEQVVLLGSPRPGTIHRQPGTASHFGREIDPDYKPPVPVAAVSAPSPTRSRSTYSNDARIRVLVSENPKRPGTASYDRFNLYNSSETVGQFLENGGTKGDLDWDTKKGFIVIE